VIKLELGDDCVERTEGKNDEACNAEGKELWRSG
jgi:hypothetical protein